MLPSVFTTCIPRGEIQKGELTEDIFAAKIRPVVEGKAPLVYQDAEVFFANTFPTEGIRTLIREVFGRLTGANVGSPIIRLETSFGGGKTHDQIALWHICSRGRRIQGLERFGDLNLIPEKGVQVAAIDGRDLDPENGIFHQDTGITTYTLWGEIAYQIGGIGGYQLLQGSDEKQISPGTSVLERLVGEEPTVIMIDEIARHLQAAKAKKVGNSDLAEQVVAFLFSLMDLAAACDRLIFVYSLASASDTFGKQTQELTELIRASARQERVMSPSTDVDIYNIVKQRLFESVQEEAGKKAATEYLKAYRAASVDLPQGCTEARYGEAIASCYPFHPELFKLLTQKIASIPDFQRTRGALRLFGSVVRHLWQEADAAPEDSPIWIPLIHSHHIPLGLDKKVQDELTSRLQRPLMRIPIQADIYSQDGRAAYAQVQDEQWQVAGKPPFSTWVARTIFLHSLTQGISSGIRRSELNLSLLTPGLEIGFVEQVLEELGRVAWYLDIDPITSIARFKEEPSINKIITEEKQQVGLSEAKEELRSRRDSIFAGNKFKLISAPDCAADVDDTPETIALCVIDFGDFVITSPQDPPPSLVETIFNNTGVSGKFRTFRNRLLFLVANRDELERAIEVVKEYKAIKAIRETPHRLDDISESQRQQLKQKEGETDLAVRVALTNTYRHLFYPAKDEVKAPKGLMHYTLSPQDSSTVKGKNNQQDLILKALRDCQKVRAEAEEDAKPFAPAYILQKVWPAGVEHWTTKSLWEEFSKNLGLNLPIEAEKLKLRETIRAGLLGGCWDMAIAQKVYIKVPDAPLRGPDTIELSDRQVLYRRGILEAPQPKEIELNAQLMPSTEVVKPVRVRWRAREAVKVRLFENGTPVLKEFFPSDEYEAEVAETTTFRLVADYGDGETATQETVVYLTTPGGTATGAAEGATLFDAKPSSSEFSGTVNRVFEELGDRCWDLKVRRISQITLSVDQIIDYRKLATAISLLSRFGPQIEQSVTLQTGQQFLRLEYQGDLRGFQGFLTTLNGLMSQPEVAGDVHLSLKFAFPTAIGFEGLATGKLPLELDQIKSQLERNPVGRLHLSADFQYD
ncbi:AAA family ATPase [Limnospira fusiformis CCALA 023]